MSYTQQLTEIKNSIHKEIVFTVVRESDRPKGYFSIDLDEPVEFISELYRPTNNEITRRLITGVNSDCNLVGTDLDGEEKTILYRDVPVEQLNLVLLGLETKKYTIKEYA